MAVDKETAQREAQIRARDAIYSGVLGALTYGELREKIVEKLGVKSRAAENRISKWTTLELVRKDASETYQKMV